MFGIRFIQFVGVALIGFGLAGLLPTIGIDTARFVSALIGALVYTSGILMEDRAGGYVSHIGTGRGGGR